MILQRVTKLSMINSLGYLLEQKDPYRTPANTEPAVRSLHKSNAQHIHQVCHKLYLSLVNQWQF